MSSLRARLVTGLLALTLVGMVTLAAVTYAEQRSFQLDRLDDQVRAAIQPVGGALRGAQAGTFPASGMRRPPFSAGGGPPKGIADAIAGAIRQGRGPQVGLPPGTYGQLRSASGKVLDQVVLSYGAAASSAPKLPAKLPLNRVVSVKTADDARYRVLAQAEAGRDGDVTVAAVPLREVDQTLHRLLLVEGLVIAAVLLLLGVAATFIVRLGLRPLDRMAQTAGAIAGGDLSHRVEPADRRSETGRLGLALNAMLTRLETAFGERQASEDRLRRFLADASHELRTPLSSIRGYAELFRIGAAREPAETEKAMRRIEEEAARMGVLVEDLLALARLDEVRELPSDAVDLAAVVRDATDDARATAPQRAITASTPVDDDEVTVIGDANGLRQVLGNLLRNALVHTPPEAAIEVAAVREGEEVVLSVRDHGPGLPTDDPGELFERFWRSEQGRERGRAGAGLGLAIVAGIVERHGGTVVAAQAEGGGAVFTVRLPAPDG